MIFIKKSISLIVMLLFCVGSQLAMEGNPLAEKAGPKAVKAVPREELSDREQYYIRWNCETKECNCEGRNLYVYCDEKGIAMAERGNSPKGIFTVNKTNEQGYQIIFTNEKGDEYFMYVPSPSCREGNNKRYGSVRFTEDVYSGSYFKILKPDPKRYQLSYEAYLIQSSIPGDYLRVKSGSGKRGVEYFACENGHCFFSFIRVKRDFFKDK